MAGALEHHVLEEVRKPRLPGLLVFGAHVVPQIHVDDGQLVILMKDDSETVREEVGLEIDTRNASGFERFFAQQISFCVISWGPTSFAVRSR
jgi:hypothetical protein